MLIKHILRNMFKTLSDRNVDSGLLISVATGFLSFLLLPQVFPGSKVKFVVPLLAKPPY